MVDSDETTDGFTKGADFLVERVLPAQLDLLQSFLPMDCWIIGRQEGSQFQAILTHGNTAGVPTATLLDALASQTDAPHAPGTSKVSTAGLDPALYRTERRASVGDALYPKYVFKAGLPDRDGRFTALVAGFLFTAEQAQYYPFHTPVIRKCLNAMAQTLNLLVDLTAADHLLVQTREGACMDALTHVLNRRGWDRVLHDARKTKDEIAIGFLDLDQLKLVNDLQGHQAGDELLKLTASWIKKSLRAHDYVARLGGDEFAVLLPDSTLSDANELSERLQHALEQEGVSVSIGMATKSEAGTLEETLELADVRMYEKKIAKRVDAARTNVMTLAPRTPRKKGL